MIGYYPWVNIMSRNWREGASTQSDASRQPLARPQARPQAGEPPRIVQAPCVARGRLIHSQMRKSSSRPRGMYRIEYDVFSRALSRESGMKRASAFQDLLFLGEIQFCAILLFRDCGGCPPHKTVAMTFERKGLLRSVMSRTLIGRSRSPCASRLPLLPIRSSLP